MLCHALASVAAAATAVSSLAATATTARAASPPVIVETPTGPVMVNGIQAGGSQAGRLLASVGSRPMPAASSTGARPYDACGAGSHDCTNAEVHQVLNLPCSRNCDQISGGDLVTVLDPVQYDEKGPYTWWGITNDVQLTGNRDIMCVIYADLDVDGNPTLIDDRPQGTQDVGSPKNLSFTVQAPIPGAASFMTQMSWTSYPGRIGSYLSSDFKTFDTAWREQGGNCTRDSQALANGAIWRVPNGTPLDWRAAFTVYYAH